MHIGDGAEYKLPKRKMDITPGKQAVGDIGRLNTIDMGAHHRDLERYKCIRERIEVAARTAPRIGYVDFGLLVRAVTSGCLRLTIVCGSCVLQCQKSIR